jgi:colanic acid biosynthesis glycosyl transferase WcaI
MPKIIFVNRFFFPDLSATSQMLADLAFSLAAREREIHVITSSQAYDDPTRTFSPFEAIQGVEIRRIATSRFGRARLFGRLFDYATFYIGAAWELFRVVRPGDIIVAKTDPPMISVVAAIVARWRGAVLINWIQDLFPEVAEALGVMTSRVIGMVLRRLRNNSLTGARCNVAIGAGMAARLLEEGIPEDRIHIIHNWSDGEEIRPIDRSANILVEQWDLEGKFVVGYSGNMGRAHEFTTLLEAAERLSANPDIVFLLIGDGAQRSSILRFAEQRGLKNIVLKPYQPREFLRLSLGVPHVHVVSLLPSLEGLIVPSKFYGIAAAGRPAMYIGDSGGEIPRILKESDCGYTISIGDSCGLADVILDMMREPALVTRLGMQARAVFERRFSKNHALLAWEQLLTRTAANRQASLPSEPSEVLSRR